VDLTLAAAECVSLRGASGSGKSRFLRGVADLDPTTGQVWLAGRRREGYAPQDWRRLVGLMPPDPLWWHDRVGPHFRPGASSETLAALGFDESVMGWEVARLSSGERQRLGLLRLLVQTPRVLLLDEPTANLDPVGTSRGEALVEGYRTRTAAAVLWVTHDEAQGRRVARRHALMDRGRLRWIDE
jgi:ABC-type iron transport system FetAB ATPase subunit